VLHRLGSELEEGRRISGLSARGGRVIVSKSLKNQSSWRFIQSLGVLSSRLSKSSRSLWASLLLSLEKGSSTSVPPPLYFSIASFISALSMPCDAAGRPVPMKPPHRMPKFDRLPRVLEVYLPACFHMISLLRVTVELILRWLASLQSRFFYSLF